MRLQTAAMKAAEAVAIKLAAEADADEESKERPFVEKMVSCLDDDLESMKEREEASNCQCEQRTVLCNAE